jgi:hypothetical protein
VKIRRYHESFDQLYPMKRITGQSSFVLAPDLNLDNVSIQDKSNYDGPSVSKTLTSFPIVVISCSLTVTSP